MQNDMTAKSAKSRTGRFSGKTNSAGFRESLSGFHCGLSEMRTASKYGTFFNPMITFNASTTIENACQLRSIHYLLDDLMIELISSWLEQESPLKVNSQVTQTGRLIRGSDIAGQLVTCLNLPS
ncbi:hypothetical protein T265_10557 [Opisthorchis viverrini]|uniref:Uncharacterized protein n=1 Tax=Opisthorchis viverrini TaxID=6198 RepID=A0A074Z651_OPIVI|nr:hypothetical protein T265_10557 [Opisthorchis viverrini]KER21032.1 hypothetical protein T265_10557 [Opisthorchis viverrini]